MTADMQVRQLEREKYRPARTVLWFATAIALVYLVLFETVGLDMALRYLGAGKNYAKILISMRELPRKPPHEQKRIFFFGDSTIAYMNESDNAPTFLEKELQDNYGKDAVDVVQWAFNGASMFHYYCLLCKAQDYSPSLFIVPINYRTFGSHWGEVTRQSEGRRIVYSELIVFAPFRERFGEEVTSMPELENLSLFDLVGMKFAFWEICYLKGVKFWLKDRFYQILFGGSPVHEQIQSANRGIREATDELVMMVRQSKHSKRFFESLYPMKEVKDDIQFRSYETLADALRRRNIPFIFYVTPLNVQEMDTYGAFDASVFDHNMEQFRKIAISNGGRFIDMSRLLGAEGFTELEHYSPEGARELVAVLLPEVERALGLTQHGDLAQPVRSRNRRDTLD